MPHPTPHIHQFTLTGIDAYDFILNHAYPVSWYEVRWFTLLVALFVGLVLFQFQKALGLYPDFILSLFGLLAEVVGFVGDTFFTHRAMRLKPEFDRRGLDFPIAETAPLLPQHPTLKDQLFGLNTLFTLLFWPVAFLVPPFGISFLFVQTCAMFTSIRQIHRLKKTLRLMDRKASDPHIPISAHQLAAL